MTDRGLPAMDGSPACPFVAFEDDRDARADRPDHRHRCFAESQPAPRAAAHQEAYCLSSAFPVCPTFQAWARREAAHARATSAGAGSPAAAPAGAIVAAADEGPGPESDDPSAEEWSPGIHDPEVPLEETPRRNPPRDWAAPPPWATGAIGSSASTAPGRGSASTPSAASGTPDFLAPRSTEGAGLAGSSADRIASGGPVVDAAPADVPSVASHPVDRPSAAPDPELAGLVAGSAAAATGADRAAAGYPPPSRTGRRPSVSSTRSSRAPAPDKPARREPVQHDGPAWEGARRYEAYPTIRTRAGIGGLPSLPRVAVLAGALGIAALAVFFVPALLGVGGKDTPAASVTPSVVAATPRPSPTPVPEPTPQVYVIKEGDTLSKIAKRNSITLDQLLAANKETIKDPDRISVGDEIIIPVPVPEEVSGGASASAAP